MTHDTIFLCRPRSTSGHWHHYNGVGTWKYWCHQAGTSTYMYMFIHASVLITIKLRIMAYSPKTQCTGTEYSLYTRIT